MLLVPRARGAGGRPPRRRGRPGAAWTRGPARPLRSRRRLHAPGPAGQGAGGGRQGAAAGGGAAQEPEAADLIWDDRSSPGNGISVSSRDSGAERAAVQVAERRLITLIFADRARGSPSWS